MGDGIFNADFELWEFHRRTTLEFMSGSRFYGLLENDVWDKVENGLIPVLDFFSKQETDFDLQDIFHRFTFDCICRMVLDYDPESLCVDLPYVSCEKAFDYAVEALFQRHILPESIWKLQKWMKIGKEKMLSQAWKVVNEFIYPKILLKNEDSNGDFKLLSIFTKAFEKQNDYPGDLKEFLRDTSLSLMFAGRDTLSSCLTWFFWLIAENPLAAVKIRKEMESDVSLNNEDSSFHRLFNVEESHKLVYLHGALCESLRLFPPLALEQKTSVQPDVLPSGHVLKANAKVIVSLYSIGRMESLWGKDCLEFKPERWITKRGGIKHEPSFKFPAFNVGPRACIGKGMAFIHMKIVAATIINRYDLQLLTDYPVSPTDSIILQAKYGLRVKLTRRNK